MIEVALTDARKAGQIGDDRAARLIEQIAEHRTRIDYAGHRAGWYITIQATFTLHDPLGKWGAARMCTLCSVQFATKYSI